MNSTEWKQMFRHLRSQYPGFSMPEPAYVEKVYFEELRQFSEKVVVKSIADLKRTSPQFFPPLGVLRNACESAAEAFAAEGKYPNVKFWPHDHGCNCEKVRTEISGPRKLLYNIAPYEAVHVLCRSNQPPRCPWCGLNVAPFINPFIQLLIETHPEDTKGWNPAHKGNVLCGSCDTLKYPEQFMRKN